MDIEDTDAGSGDTINGVDAFLVGSGVAAVALVPTYFLTIVKAKQFGAMLNPKQRARSDFATLGPGLFFVASIPFILLVTALIVSSVEGPSPERVELARQTGGAFEFGSAIGQFMDAMENRITSGDFWRAAATALPIFAFAVALAVPLRTFAWAVKGWTTRHAMGAALYITGGVLIGTGLVVLVGVLSALVFGGVFGGLLVLFGIVMVFGMTAMQIYGFASAFEVVSEAKLGFLSAMTPLFVVALMCAFAFLVVGALPPAADAAASAG